MMQTAQQSPFNPQQSPYSGQQSVRGNYRTEQNFYKQPSGGFRPEQPQQPPQQHQQMPRNYGYPPESRNSHSQMSQYNGGMGAQNYNAYNQKEYEDLKEQFFRQPANMGHPAPMDHYSRMS